MVPLWCMYPSVKIHPTPHLRWVDFFASKLYLNKADLKREREKKKASFLIPNWSQNFPLLYEERQVQSPAPPPTPEEGERGGPERSWSSLLLLQPCRLGHGPALRSFRPVLPVLIQQESETLHQVLPDLYPSHTTKAGHLGASLTLCGSG